MSGKRRRKIEGDEGNKDVKKTKTMKEEQEMRKRKEKEEEIKRTEEEDKEKKEHCSLWCLFFQKSITLFKY
jgi:hypothetical protein